MNKSEIKDLLFSKLDENNIITGNQIEHIKKNSNLNNIDKIIDEILEEYFIYNPIPLPNKYNTSAIYIVR